MNPKILKKLEELTENPKGILSMCCECKSIKVVFSEEEFYWINGEDSPMYKSIVEKFTKLANEGAKRRDYTQGITHGYCPEDFSKYMEELKK